MIQSPSMFKSVALIIKEFSQNQKIVLRFHTFSLLRQFSKKKKKFQAYTWSIKKIARARKYTCIDPPKSLHNGASTKNYPQRRFTWKSGRTEAREKYRKKGVYVRSRFHCAFNFFFFFSFLFHPHNASLVSPWTPDVIFRFEFVRFFFNAVIDPLSLTLRVRNNQRVWKISMGKNWVFARFDWLFEVR